MLRRDILTALLSLLATFVAPRIGFAKTEESEAQLLFLRASANAGAGYETNVDSNAVEERVLSSTRNRVQPFPALVKLNPERNAGALLFPHFLGQARKGVQQKAIRNLF